MRDLVMLASTIDPDLPEYERRIKLCELLLTELGTLKGRDLAPYLSDFSFDMVMPGTVICLKFPVEAHVFDPLFCNIESDK